MPPARLRGGISLRYQPRNQQTPTEHEPADVGYSTRKTNQKPTKEGRFIVPTIRRGRRSEDSFTRVPNETARYNFGKLGPGSVLVYLLSHEEGWTTNERYIAEALGVGRGAVRSAMNVLIEHGFVERNQTRTESGEMGPNTYVVHDHPVGTVVGSTVVGSTVVGFTAHGETAYGEPDHIRRLSFKKTNIQEEQVKKTNVVSHETNGADLVKPSAAKRKYTEAFNAFWDDYRTATAKPAGSKFNAAKQWGKLSADDRRAAHAAVAMYCAENEFTKHAERYLGHRDFDSYDGVSLAEVQAAATPTLPMFRPKTAAGLESIDRIVSQVFANEDANQLGSENQPPRELNQ